MAGIEGFLGRAGFDRAPWLAVAFAAGIAAWFGLATPWQWASLIAGCGAAILLAAAFLGAEGPYPYLRGAVLAVPALTAAGCLTVWLKSELVGAPPIARPAVEKLTATILERTERVAEKRARLVVATRLAGMNGPVKVRLNLPEKLDQPQIEPGAVIRVQVRLMPPAPPMLPGAFNFARTAWFAGLSATGTVISPVEIVRQGGSGQAMGRLQASLSRHITNRLDGSSGAIAAALATGDRGSIAEEDARAMRDAGLAHLLSISGLHVSAVIGGAYLLAITVLALWPWLALRVRLPVVGAAIGALAGIGYTLLTGAEVPTVRSCVGALLVLLALALGREALSLRMLATAAFLVLLFWPEAIVGPSFQMSFAAVLAIIALNTSDPVRKFLGPREEAWWMRTLRHLGMLLLTGFVIELTLMPIGLYHFHRAGIYGAIANVIAIPLTTLVTMPLIALALLLDIVGAGALAWLLSGWSLDAMIALAHWVSSRPGAVTVLPAMGSASFILFVLGGLWLGLWRDRLRWLGLVPAAAGATSLLLLRPPDILVSGDGRHVGIVRSADELLVLRDSRSSYGTDNLLELAGMDGNSRLLTDWEGARCNRDFCTAGIERDGMTWHLLLARSRNQVPERELAAACDLADIVIADRGLPRSCRPRWLKADRRLLSRTGGIAIDLERAKVATVAANEGEHGWWRPPPRRPQ